MEKNIFFMNAPVSNPNETHYVTKGKEKGAKEEGGNWEEGEKGQAREAWLCVCEYEIQYNEIHYCVYIICNNKSKMLQKYNLI